MQIPGHLRQQVALGRVALVLGAGASMEGTADDGSSPPSADELRDLIADEFLDGCFKQSPLGMVSEYAINESDLVTVQQFVAQTFSKYSPGAPHRLLPELNWRGLATTNYDMLVETAYGLSEGQQRLVPFSHNSDRVDKKLQEEDTLAFLKLHGCVSRVTNPDCPFILTPDQFLAYESGRNHIFQMLVDWMRESPTVFIGHRIDDINFRVLLSRLKRDVPSLPRYYMVTPSPGGIVTRYWEKRNVRTLDGTFGDFISKLHKNN